MVDCFYPDEGSFTRFRQESFRIVAPNDETAISEAKDCVISKNPHHFEVRSVARKGGTVIYTSQTSASGNGFFRCNPCHKVFPLIDKTKNNCPSCGGTDGEVMSSERFREGFNAGTYFNIDPKTGRRREHG